MTISPKLRAWLVDAAERLGATFAEAFLGAFTLSGGFDALLSGHLDRIALHAAASAGIAALAALVKAAVAAKVKGTVSPASLAPQQQPGQAEQKAPGQAGTSSAAIVRTVILPEQHVDGKPLGRHVHHDERSRAYAVQAVDRSKLVSVRHHRLVPPYDQGSLGSCTGNACAGALSTAPFRHRFTEAKAVAIYKAATRIDDVPGQYPPDDTGSSGLAVAKVAKQLGYCSSYLHCFDLDAVLTALQMGPVMLGVGWLRGFDVPTADGQMRLTGSQRGGHELVADEIDVERQRVWITQSWGRWGIDGRAWWSWDDLTRILANQGDATVLVP